MKYEIEETEPGIAKEPFDMAEPRGLICSPPDSDVIEFYDDRFYLTDTELRDLAAKSIEAYHEGRYITADQAKDYFNRL